MTTMDPYLVFDGLAEEAFEFYKSAFGGEYSALQRFKDVPASAAEAKLPEGEKIMHVALPVGKNTLMGSDAPASRGPVTTGSNYSISLNVEDRGEADRLFGALSQGGKVTMPLSEAFWDSYFGMFTDKYGVNWMINCPNKKQ